MSDSLKQKLREVPHQPGVYVMKDRLGAIIYVGKARDLKKRLASYFMASRKTRADRKTRALIDTIADFDIHLTRNETEALLLEGKLIKDYRPRYNVTFRDDKRFLLAKIKPSDPWPRFQLTRVKNDESARYFGPFPHSTALRETISWINRRFGLRVCRPRNPGEAEYRHCHADVIRNCSAPCVGRISHDDYLARVEDACTLLSGKGRREIFDELETEMQAAAERMNFERAATLRDVLENLRKTLNPSRRFSRGRGMPTTVKPTEDIAELGEELGLPGPPRVMECFDISNVSSNHIVASMVRFTDGLPDNQAYRRYRIRSVEGQNDFASMAEVVRRRYAHILQANAEAVPDATDSQESLIEIHQRLAAEGRTKILLPNLIIVDGGKGQLSSAMRELQRLGLHELPIVGLAKQHEEIFFPNKTEPLRLDHSRGALRLLQRIRDEAHRFANRYNELLYRRRMKESLLDECPAISPRRKQQLLKTFGSIARIRNASPTDLAKLPGISTKAAEEILTWLNSATR